MFPLWLHIPWRPLCSLPPSMHIVSLSAHNPQDRPQAGHTDHRRCSLFCCGIVGLSWRMHFCVIFDVLVFSFFYLKGRYIFCILISIIVGFFYESKKFSPNYFRHSVVSTGSKEVIPPAKRIVVQNSGANAFLNPTRSNSPDLENSFFSRFIIIFYNSRRPNESPSLRRKIL